MGHLKAGRSLDLHRHLRADRRRRLLHRRRPYPVRERLDAAAPELGARTEYVRRADETNLLRLYAVGRAEWKNALEKQTVRQRNNLAGRVGKVRIKDLYGWAKVGLAKLARAVGVPMANKEKLDAYKTCMWRGLLEHPEDFLRYDLDDARVLLTIYHQFVRLIRAVQKDCLGMDEADLWNEHDIPMTAGALVARSLERWLHSQAGEHKDALRFCIRKLGSLDQDHPEHVFNRLARDRAVGRYRCPEDLRLGLASDSSLRRFLNARFLFTGLDSCGIRYWADRSAAETAVHNALVQGGRCNNEMPFEYAVGPGLDGDLASCYREALRELDLPAGHAEPAVGMVQPAAGPVLPVAGGPGLARPHSYGRPAPYGADQPARPRPRTGVLAALRAGVPFPDRTQDGEHVHAGGLLVQGRLRAADGERDGLRDPRQGQVQRQGAQAAPDFRAVRHHPGRRRRLPGGPVLHQGGSLKVGRYLQAQKSRSGYENLKDLLPGDNVPDEVYLARFNNVHFPLCDVAEFRRRRDRRAMGRGGEPARWFERYGSEGILAVHRAMASDKLRGA